jgi:hypothetical protein
MASNAFVENRCTRAGRGYVPLVSSVGFVFTVLGFLRIVERWVDTFLAGHGPLGSLMVPPMAGVQLNASWDFEYIDMMFCGSY